MKTTSLKRFRDNFNNYIAHIISTHTPLRVTQQSGESLVIMRAEDWEQEQETLYILQNSDLMQQISQSFSTHQGRMGYQPTVEQINEITCVLGKNVASL